MVVMQREMADPFGGDSVAQRLGQIAASRNPSRRHLRQQTPQATCQIGHGGKLFGHVCMTRRHGYEYGMLPFGGPPVRGRGR